MDKEEQLARKTACSVLFLISLELERLLPFHKEAKLLGKRSKEEKPLQMRPLKGGQTFDRHNGENIALKA